MKILNYNLIDKYLSDKKFKNIFLISGKNSYLKSGANIVFNKLLKNKNYVKYYKRNSIPDFYELKDIIKLVEKFKPDLILAIGGGAVIDYAKMANCLDPDLSAEQIRNNNLVFKKKSKLCAIPTTAGSGAEVTENAVLYIDNIKTSIENKKIKPDNFFLVPEFILSSEVSLKASSGFDAIAQGVESILSLKSNSKSIDYSKKSLSYSLASFEKFIKIPNLNNVRNMCIAANLSGKAISITRTTAPHAISYPFTSLYNIDHGHAVSLTLTKFLNFNFVNIHRAKDKDALKKKYKLLFNITKTKSILELCQYFDHLKKVANLEFSLKKLNVIIKSDYDRIISGINLDRLKNNPIEIFNDDIKKILFEIK